MSSLRTQRWALPSGRGVPEPVATRLAALFLADPVAELWPLFPFESFCPQTRALGPSPRSPGEPPERRPRAAQACGTGVPLRVPAL